MPGQHLKRIPSKGWAALIRRVYEVDLIVCSKCGGTMETIAFIEVEVWVISDA
jgi:hypothetical protein